MTKLYAVVNKNGHLWSPEDAEFYPLIDAIRWSSEAIIILDNVKFQLPYAKKKDASAVIKQVTITFTDLPSKQ